MIWLQVEKSVSTCVAVWQESWESISSTMWCVSIVILSPQTAMAPKKRAVNDEEMTMQTRKAARFSYSELDEDQGFLFFIFLFLNFFNIPFEGQMF